MNAGISLAEARGLVLKATLGKMWEGLGIVKLQGDATRGLYEGKVDNQSGGGRKNRLEERGGIRTTSKLGRPSLSINQCSDP